MGIDHWRARIDELDEQIVELLNERAKAALAIGELKRGQSTPIYDPAREQRVLDHVASHSDGPLSGEAIRRLYALIIKETRQLEAEHVGEVTETGESA